MPTMLCGSSTTQTTFGSRLLSRQYWHNSLSAMLLHMRHRPSLSLTSRTACARCSASSRLALGDYTRFVWCPACHGKTFHQSRPTPDRSPTGSVAVLPPPELRSARMATGTDLQPTLPSQQINDFECVSVVLDEGVECEAH